MICKLCNVEISNKGFGSHLKHKHNMKTKEYYDLYFKEKGEGVCLVCKNHTKFISASKGYKKFCSSKCVGIGTKEKSKETCINKYGVDNIWKSNNYRKKYVKSNNIEQSRKTKLKRYGDSNYNNREKAKETWIEKYGVDSPLKVEKIRKNISNKVKKENYYKLKSDIESYNFTLLTTIKEYFDNSTKIKIKCDKNHTFETFLSNWHKRKYCVVCSINSLQTLPEKEIHKFLIEHNINFKPSCRSIITPQELDIFLPDYNLAIEFNGLYWHNDNILNKNYHLNKTNLCKEKNIQLIHIFEHEWLFKQEIVKSILLSRLGLITNKIYARKCEIKEVNSKDSKYFLDYNHLQGNCISSINLGLYYNNELVFLMSFGKRHITGNYNNNFELLRMCSKLYCNIIGGFSKLLKYFLKNYNDNLYSYVDKRYFNGNSYILNGFKLISESSPNYWWFDRNYNFYHRSNFQKHKLKKKLNIFDINLSEVKNMKNNNYLRIWDCGNYIFKI